MAPTRTASTSELATSSERTGRGRAARRALVLSCLCLASLWVHTARAEGTYLEPQIFLAQSFPDGVPDPRVLWINRALRGELRDLLGEEYGALRLRHWTREQRSAWILEAIGKEKPITVGIVTGEHGIERLEVLVFRESRGWEVRRSAFTAQFRSARLDDDRRLDRPIDGITGATLSVRALQKLARMSLFLHQRIRQADDPA